MNVLCLRSSQWLCGVVVGKWVWNWTNLGSSTATPLISCVALGKTHKPQFSPLKGNNPCPAGLFQVGEIKLGKNGHSQRRVVKSKFHNQDGSSDKPEPRKY